MTVFERADRIGGLLRYGLPEVKMEKRVLVRRLALLEAEGIVFKPNSNIGVNVLAADLKSQFDAVVIAVGSTVPRDLPILPDASSKESTTRWNSCRDRTNAVRGT